MKLTNEHAIPRGIGGLLILYEACCATCQAIINEFENALLHKSWGVARAKLGFASYNKPGRPTSAPVELQQGDTMVGAISLLPMPPRTSSYRTGIRPAISPGLRSPPGTCRAG